MHLNTFRDARNLYWGESILNAEKIKNTTMKVAQKKRNTMMTVKSKNTCQYFKEVLFCYHPRLTLKSLSMNATCSTKILSKRKSTSNRASYLILQRGEVQPISLIWGRWLHILEGKRKPTKRFRKSMENSKLSTIVDPLVSVKLGSSLRLDTFSTPDLIFLMEYSI